MSSNPIGSTGPTLRFTGDSTGSGEFSAFLTGSSLSNAATGSPFTPGSLLGTASNLQSPTLGGVLTIAQAEPVALEQLTPGQDYNITPGTAYKLALSMFQEFGVDVDYALQGAAVMMNRVSDGNYYNRVYGDGIQRQLDAPSQVLGRYEFNSSDFNSLDAASRALAREKLGGETPANVQRARGLILDFINGLGDANRYGAARRAIGDIAGWRARGDGVHNDFGPERVSGSSARQPSRIVVQWPNGAPPAP